MVCMKKSIGVLLVGEADGDETQVGQIDHIGSDEAVDGLVTTVVFQAIQLERLALHAEQSQHAITTQRQVAQAL